MEGNYQFQASWGSLHAGRRAESGRVKGRVVRDGSPVLDNCVSTRRGAIDRRASCLERRRRGNKGVVDKWWVSALRDDMLVTNFSQSPSPTAAAAASLSLSIITVAPNVFYLWRKMLVFWRISFSVRMQRKFRII